MSFLKRLSCNKYAVLLVRCTGCSLASLFGGRCMRRDDPGRTFRIAKGIFVVHRNDRILLRGVWVIKMGLAGVRVK